EIRRLHDAFRITTVYVTHDQSEAMVTSDRIVVMNQGRIEQVDEPFALYNRPRTRFVAGFVGSTNFLEGSLAGGEIGFPGFAFAAALFPAASELGRKVVFSVRPQTIRLHRKPGGGTSWWVAGRIARRAYLGDAWDYFVDPGGGGTPIRVAAAPEEVFASGEAVWLEIDPQRVAHIAEDT
ncbi:MAG: TOBE domain-containing protein, partial [Alphaproteobacteria bacterium]